MKRTAFYLLLSIGVIFGTNLIEDSQVVSANEDLQQSEGEIYPPL
ncbi:hypothetical protein RZN22_11085 [Bacillaceae bacterium S4-13-58]